MSRRKSELAEMFLDMFRKTNCRTGQGFMTRNLQFQLFDKLNPVEKDAFDEVLNDLYTNGYFEVDSIEKPSFFKLTQKGYDYIYDDKALLDCCFDNEIAKQESVSKTRALLVSYPNIQQQVDQALAKIEAGIDERNVIDDFRLSLELLLREVLGNNKSLENQTAEIGQYLKNKGVSAQFRNMFEKMIDYYSKYQNEYVKHNDKVESSEIDFVVNITLLFMRVFLV
ncbi:MAG: hypothetical protein IKJ81_08105 [Bacteroidales bacterium]|nr:hypothetical protein [Bacteroidales bacterium]